jgi:lipid A 3-O-deacylase
MRNASRAWTRWLWVGLILALPGPALGQQKWSGWNVYWENDSFVPSKYGSDARYTNGVRYTLARDPEWTWGWAERLGERFGEWGLFGDRSYSTTSALVVGENFFTPTLIVSFVEDPTDRPFAGFLYAGARVDMTQDVPSDAGLTTRLQHSLEFDVGVLGPPALAKTIQKGVHLLRQNRIPKGWGHQLSTEPAVQISYLGRVSVRLGLLDIVPHVGVQLGTVQTYVNAGVTARLGNMTAFPSLLNPWTVAAVERESWFQWSLLAAIEGRAYARNAYVDGNLFGDDLQITPDHMVQEWRLGAMTRLGVWSLNYTFVHRGTEFRSPPALGDGQHSFGSVTLGRDLTGALNSAEQSKWLKRDWIFEASLGQGVSWERTSPARGPRRSGVAMRGGLSKGLTEHILLGGELAGVLREGGPPDADGFHEDTFYITKAVTLGWRPWGRTRRFILRGGVGSASAKVQRTRERDRSYTREDDGRGVLFGVSYGIPTGVRASIGVDLTWSNLSVGSAQGAPAAFWSWGVGFRWHP